MRLDEFLLARIAEDQSVARGCADVEGAREWTPHIEYASWVEGVYMGAARGEDYSSVAGETAWHIARWDPARVQAECEAKRRIVALHDPYEAEVLTSDDEENVTLCRGCHDDFPCRTLRLIAQPYAEHPDFDPAWRLA